jgi:hypothetical protein
MACGIQCKTTLLFLPRYKQLIYAKKWLFSVMMSRMDNLCRAWTRMSVLDNAFGLLLLPGVRINCSTWAHSGAQNIENL